MLFVLFVCICVVVVTLTDLALNTKLIREPLFEFVNSFSWFSCDCLQFEDVSGCFFLSTKNPSHEMAAVITV